MRIFWWQGGLHIEAENKEEHAALKLIWDARKTSLNEGVDLSGRGSVGQLDQQNSQ